METNLLVVTNTYALQWTAIKHIINMTISFPYLRRIWLCVSKGEVVLYYFLESEEAVKKGVADVMGGKVLQLESERLLAEGAARFAKLVEILLAQDKVEEVKKVASDDKLREEDYALYHIE